jgi:hypothetical protein
LDRILAKLGDLEVTIYSAYQSDMNQPKKETQTKNQEDIISISSTDKERHVRKELQVAVLSFVILTSG